mmetsp:Transcript_145955/g.254683  ORF Transcript_145955/g.254683 Transcript_145955/m.254683 type:complete len:220 (+) Transcript_145955:96-755(+)
MATAEKIELLLRGGGRYDVEILPELETYLEEQLSEGHYDIDANLAILKLYLLYPNENKVEVIQNILLKALMAFPETHFALCMYQIPQKYRDSLKDPIRLAQHLEMAKFKAFWKDAEVCEALGKAKGWQDAVRQFVAGVVSSTYRSIRSDQLADLLNLPAGELGPVVTKQGWTWSKDDSELVIVREQAAFESANVETKVQQTSAMTLDMYRQLFVASTGA